MNSFSTSSNFCEDLHNETMARWPLSHGDKYFSRMGHIAGGVEINNSNMVRTMSTLISTWPGKKNKKEIRKKNSWREKETFVYLGAETRLEIFPTWVCELILR